MCLVNAQTHLVRICKQTRFKKCFVAGIEVGAQLFFLFFVCRTISRVLELTLKDGCRPHCRAPPVERTPPGKSEPGLVPEEDQVRLDGQALFHDPLYVIDVPIKRADRQHQEPCSIELPFNLQIEQSLLDCAYWHRTIHEVLRKRISRYIQ